jgi:hypothetical protein
VAIPGVSDAKEPGAHLGKRNEPAGYPIEMIDRS